MKMCEKTTTTSNGTSVRKRPGHSRAYLAVWLFGVLLTVFLAGCKKDDTYTGEIIGLCPVVATDPMDQAVDVALSKVISATFNTAMKATTINQTTFVIEVDGAEVTGTVGPAANGNVFTFTPDAPLLPFKKYMGTITSGA